MTKSCHNLTKRKFFGNAASPMQSEWRLQVFSLPFTLHWRCNISENLLFVRLWREFIVNLWVNWNWGCLKNCFQSPGSSARLHSLCAPFQCILRLSGIVLILTICVCFSNCCFGILMSRSFSFKQSIWQVNPGSQCLKTACPKEASGNTLHHHTMICTHLKKFLHAFYLFLDSFIVLTSIIVFLCNDCWVSLPE